MKNAVTITSVASIYREPSFRSEMVTQSLMGEVLEVSEQQGQWYHVTLPDGYKGWVYHFYIRAPEEKIVWGQADLFVRKSFAEAVISADERIKIPFGARIKMKEEKEQTVCAELPDGTTAEISASDILQKCNLPLAKNPRDIIQTAYQFYGTPYLWGGKSYMGLDCSGFVQLVYMLYGINLPRDSGDQYKSDLLSNHTGKPEELEPGNLYFFSENRKNVSHVAISLGEGRFIHASGCVKVNSLNPMHGVYYSERLKEILVGSRAIY